MCSYTEKELIEAVKQSFSYSEVLRKLNLSITGSSHRCLKNKIIKLNLDTNHFNRYKPAGKNIKKYKPANERLIYNIHLKNRLDASSLRRALLEIGREYKCEKCHNNGIWCDNKITLEIDHINGNWRDNTSENLRFLCPNCHSQISNFAHVKPKKEKKIRDPLTWKSKLRDLITKSQLEILLWEKSTVQIAKDFNVSDKAIEKLAKKWNLKKPPRGYWAKQRNKE